jgi:hypothetical protein
MSGALPRRRHLGKVTHQELLTFQIKISAIPGYFLLG